MFCTECGSEIPDGVRFCVKCGTPVQGAGAAEESRGPAVEGPTVETHATEVPYASDVSEPASPAAPRPRRRLVVIVAVIVALVLAGVVAFVTLGGADADGTVTVAYGSDDPVTVTRAARIIPTSSEGTPLEHYVVRIKSAAVTDSEGVSLTDLPVEYEVSGSEGFAMQDLHPDIPEGTYVLEIDDGEETQVTPPIVIDEERGTSEEVVIEPDAESQDDSQDDEEDEDEEDATDEASAMSDEDAEELYRDVLDMFYENIQSGWEDYEEAYKYGSLTSESFADVSYLFTFYFPMYEADSANLDTIGYQFTDLNDDGVPELLIGMEGFKDFSADLGAIIDLYTVKDGQIVHVLTSGERFRYLFCEDGTIYLSGSSGWASNYYVLYELVDGELSPIECVWSEPDSSNEVHWYHSTTDLYADDEVEITETEATEITDSWPQLVDLTLTPFSEYVS